MISNNNCYIKIIEASYDEAEMRLAEARLQDNKTYISVASTTDDSLACSTFDPAASQYLPAAAKIQQLPSAENNPAVTLYTGTPQTEEAAVNPAPPYEQLQLNSSDAHAYQHITTTSELPNVSVQSSATDSQYNSNGLSNNPSSGQVIDSVEC